MNDAFQTLTTTDHSYNYDLNVEDEEGEDGTNNEEENFCDVETWESLNKSFKEVQSVLDHNRLLIEQVNDNHRSRLPRNMAKNVELINQINTNMSRVIGLYSNLSRNFSGVVQQRRGMANKVHVQNL